MTHTDIEIVEVSPRDGLQNEKTPVSTATKLELITRALDAGVRRIEIASFVNPRRVPQMADAEAVCEGFVPREGVTSVGLVLNTRGAERALQTKVDELGAVACASEGFAAANQNRSPDETVEDAIAICDMARAAGRRAQVTISVAFGCPFDGFVDPARVVAMARRLADAGICEIALGDTIGVANPAQVRNLLSRLRSAIPGVSLRCHFHDTRNTAIANAYAATLEGVRVLDSSIGGLGGCPFAPGASGNVASEDLVYMLHGAGLETGLAIDDLIAAARWLSPQLGKSLSSLARAGNFQASL